MMRFGLLRRWLPVATDMPLRPLMSAREIACLEAHLRQAQTYLEFGCGGSTLMAVQSSPTRIVSVDSDRRWIATCRNHPAIATGLDGGGLMLLHVDVGKIRRFGYPRGKGAAQRWPDYYLAPWDHFGGGLPDLVLVDGRFRIACIVQALLRCPPDTTILVHDFTLRAGYRDILPFVETVEIVDTLAVLRAKPGHDPRALARLGFSRLFDRE